MRKRFFVEILKEICAEEKLELEIFSYEWLCRITNKKTNQTVWTEGYNFDLNSSVNYLVLNDKVSTSIVLESSGIPCIRHFLIIKESWRENLEIEKTYEVELREILEKTGDKVVVKFASGSQGNNVFLCTGKNEIENVVSLLKDKQNLAISKYYESQFEYRFYLLDGQTLFAYKKKKGSSWKHNLSQGATAQLFTNSDPKYLELEELAQKAFATPGLRLGAVDILETEDGPKVIEINNGIMMDSFAATSFEYKQIAKEAHRKILFKSLEK